MPASRIVIAVLCLALSVARGAPARSQPRHVIKLATEAAADSPQAQQLYALAAELEAHTDGAAQAKIFPGGHIGSGVSLLKRVQAGEVQIAALPYEVLEQSIPVLAVLSAPFVFRDLEQSDRALDRHAPSVLRAILAEANVRFVTQGESVMRHWFVSGDAPVSPRELSERAIWSRDNVAEKAEWEALGITPLAANATSADKPFWFRATAAEARLSGRDTLCTTIIRAHDVLSGHLIVMSQVWFDGLPEDVKKELARLKSHSAEEARKAARDLDAELMARMQQRGLEVQDLPAVAMRKFQRHGRRLQRKLAAVDRQHGLKLLARLRRR